MTSLGTFSFAAAGTFAAMEKKLDPFEVLIVSFATAIGGGTIRDVLIGELPVAWLNNTTIITVILIAALSTLFFGSQMRKLDRILFLFDSMGLGLSLSKRIIEQYHKGSLTVKQSEVGKGTTFRIVLKQ